MSTDRFHKTILFVVCCILLSDFSQIASGTIQVNSWNLLTTVRNLSTGDFDTDGHFEVENPFVANQFASVGNSTAETDHDFVWDATGGRFRSDGTHNLQGMASSFVESRSTVRIFFTPLQDLFLTIDAEYIYDLPADPMDVRFEFSVVDIDDLEILFSERRVYSTILGWPASDTFVIQESILLPASANLAIRYNMELDVSPAAAGSTATGSGFVEFNITPIPEPASLVSLLIACLWLRPRRQR